MDEEHDEGDEPPAAPRPRRRSRRLHAPPPPTSGAPSPRVRVVAFGLVALASCCLSTMMADLGRPKWSEIAPAGGGFSALFPGTPNVRETLQQTPGGATRMSFFSVSSRSLGRSYCVVRTRPESQRIDDDRVEAILDRVIADAGPAYNGEAGQPHRIAQAGLQGREIEIHNAGPDRTRITLRVFVTRGSIWQIVAEAQRGATTPEDARFLDSFRVTAEDER